MVFQTREGFSLRVAGAEGAGERSAGVITPAAFALRVRSSPFASISFGNGLGVPGSSPSLRKEHASGMDFPLDLCHKAKPCAELTGLGVRFKRLLGIKNINVYAVGLYVDSIAAKKALSKYAGESVDAIANNEKMFDDVVKSDAFEKSLRLVISFGSLKRTQFLDALQERLEGPMGKAGESSTLDQFRAQFDDITLTKGTEIVFVQEGTSLVTKVDGQRKGTIASPALCSSLFDIYLGADPVSPDAKETFGKGLAATLKA